MCTVVRADEREVKGTVLLSEFPLLRSHSFDSGNSGMEVGSDRGRRQHFTKSLIVHYAAYGKGRTFFSKRPKTRRFWAFLYTFYPLVYLIILRVSCINWSAEVMVFALAE